MAARFGKLHPTIIGLALVAVFVGIAIPAAGAQLVSADGGCTIPETAASRQASARVWLADPAVQERVQALGDAVRSQFGEVSKEDPNAQLRRGYLGTVVDHPTRSMVVVVDPTRVDRAALDARLTAAAAPSLPVRVQAGCFSATELMRARDLITARGWHQQARATDYGVYLDARNSRFRVMVDERDAAVVEPLKSTLGDLVRVDRGTARRTFGRTADESPHWGGSYVHWTRPGDDVYCSTAFSVRLANGHDGAITAGHCFPNGTPTGSGPYYYGTAGGRSNYPAYDMEWLASARADQRYYPKVYGDPGATSRTVVGAAEAAVGMVVCKDGAVTKEACGWEVERLDYDRGDTPAMMLMSQWNWWSPPIRHGDSGGPIYSLSGSNATARGIIIGGGNTLGTGYVWGERWNSIRTHLNVTIVRS